MKGMNESALPGVLKREKGKRNKKLEMFVQRGRSANNMNWRDSVP